MMSGTFSYTTTPLTTSTFKGVILQKGANKIGFGHFLTPAALNLDGNGENGGVSLLRKSVAGALLSPAHGRPW